MITTQAARSAVPGLGTLRPIDPARDLGPVADLIAVAFAHEMDERGRAALREMRWMARLSPLVWWWSQADPSFRESLNGFVWEEAAVAGHRRQIVGNASLSRAPGNRQAWIICNVVVRSDQQGRGIGRRLAEAALDEARALGAEDAVLQVYQDNPRARELYRSLGFEEATGETELRLEAKAAPAPVEAPGYQVRAWKPADGQAAYELAALVTPAALRWLRPLRPTDYRMGWPDRLGERLAGLAGGWQIYRLVAMREDRLVGMMVVTAHFRRGEGRLAILVDPEHRGQVEAAFVSRALYMLGAMPVRAIRATVDKDHTAACEALRGYGFAEGRTLLTMWKRL